MIIKGSAFVHIDQGMQKAETGAWTWPLLAVICPAADPLGAAGNSNAYRRAVRALDDAGVLRLRLGHRAVFGTATFEWLPLAYLPPRVNERRLADVDAEALATLL
jgi:hypothetical protein